MNKQNETEIENIYTLKTHREQWMTESLRAVVLLRQTKRTRAGLGTWRSVTNNGQRQLKKKVYADTFKWPLEDQ